MPHNKHFIILPRDPALDAVDGATIYNVREKVRELSGSDVLGYKSVAAKLRREGIVYVAVRSTGERERFGAGFLLVDTRNARAVEQLRAVVGEVPA